MPDMRNACKPIRESYQTIFRDSMVICVNITVVK